MPTERERDVVTGQPEPELIQRRMEAGWRMVAIEWERGGTAARNGNGWWTQLPYGLRVANDCGGLELNPEEVAVLTLMQRMIATERTLRAIADELNQQGYKTRNGGSWTMSAVYNLLPRLVEFAPYLLNVADKGR